MRAGWQRAACGWGVALSTWLLSGCGDAAGHPIRGITSPDAGLHSSDSGHDMLDAMSSATVLDPFPPMDPPDDNQGPGAMHDGHPNDEVPLTPFCLNAATWPEDLRDDEQRMAQAISDWRAAGFARCGNRMADRLPVLDFPPELRCSARLHSFDMVAGGYFDQVSPDGTAPGQRMSRAGFRHSDSAESIARGGSDPTQVLIDLLGNPQDCANFTSSEFTALGIGEYRGVWTFDFAAEP
jgi:uncharacterized protein YkwD